MFIFTAKLTKKKLIALVTGCGLLLCGLVFWVYGHDSAVSRETAGTIPLTQGIKTNADRLAYLSSLGWETGAQEIGLQEVRIPDSFDDVMTSYNQLQQEHGFDLLKYKGKRVMRYTYEVLNHEDSRNGVYAELLVYKNQIIGGDLHNNAPDGFIQGLAKRMPCGCAEHQGACPTSCTCDICQNQTELSSATETSGMFSSNDTLSSGALDESDFFDAGYFDEGLIYEDEMVSNADGLPPTPEPDVIEPR